jgi:hypothetical protein
LRWKWLKMEELIETIYIFVDLKIKSIENGWK